jgi:hypothetical protein
MGDKRLGTRDEGRRISDVGSPAILQRPLLIAHASSPIAVQFVFLPLFVLLCGCGPASRSEPVARLEGNVTVHGKPLPEDAEGSLVFSPAKLGEAPPCQAKLVGGHYLADKVPRGQVTVAFLITRRTGKMLKTSPDDIHPTPERINLVPEALRDGLHIEIQGDNAKQDFDLK